MIKKEEDYSYTARSVILGFIHSFLFSINFRVAEESAGAEITSELNDPSCQVKDSVCGASTYIT